MESLMFVDANAHIPVYEQIIQYICGVIAAEVYRSGEALPSIRALSLELMVNPNTVQRAYQELERLGLAHKRRGLGIFVADDGGDIAKRMSEEAVRSRFSQGIRIARSAHLDPPRLEILYRQALGAAGTTNVVNGAGERPRDSEKRP